MEYPIVFGIDLGNTNTSIAYKILDPNSKSPSTNFVCLDSEADGVQRHIMPSAVLYQTPDGEAILGRKARALALDKGMLFVNFKESLLCEGPPETRLEKGVKKSAVDALTDLLRYTLEQAAGTTGIISYFMTGPQGKRIPKRSFHLTLGVPTETSETYRTHLKTALKNSGWFPSDGAMEDYVSFVAEPVAVVLNVQAKDRRNFTVYDHGGLTLDIAQVEVETDEMNSPKYLVKSKHRIVSKKGAAEVNVGGSFCDRLLLRFLVRREGGVEAIKKSIEKGYGAEDLDLDQFSALVKMDQEPEGETYERKLYDRLCSDIELVRIKLSERANAVVVWNARTLTPFTSEFTISEDELENEVLSTVSQSIEQQLSQDDDAASVHILAGGVSMTPFLTARYNKLFPGKALKLSDVSPITAIAAGLASYYKGGVGTDEPEPDITDTDFGIYNDQDAKWEIVLRKGTNHKDTILPLEGLPPEGAGISKAFRAFPATKEIVIQVGECVKGEWRKLGDRDIRLPDASTRFLIYLQADRSGILKLRIADKVNRQLINVENPMFDISKNKI